MLWLVKIGNHGSAASTETGLLQEYYKQGLIALKAKVAEGVTDEIHSDAHLNDALRERFSPYGLTIKQ